ncbi:MAG: nucleotide exchange factor GrpE [Pyrinomonadaceae bacterium]
MSSIPVHFFDEEDKAEDNNQEGTGDEPGSESGEVELQDEISLSEADSSEEGEEAGERLDTKRDEMSGPMLAELLATRAELKRVENELAETQDRFTRRQADFENYRKRTERERGETQSRVVAEVVSKLLPVIDNLRRALEAERSLEANESEEFRHFLHGVELINKQLNEVLESLGLETVPAIGEHFDPHVHEAVVSEPTDEYEPETVIQELARGYRIGERLLRPAMVKVATEPSRDG